MQFRSYALTAFLLLSADMASAAPSPAFVQTTERIIATARALQQAPGASPGLAIVAVPSEGDPVIWAEGRVWAQTPREVDENTPFYIASMTKAYVGLLAIELDRKGIFPLDTTLEDIWPGLAIEAVADPGSVTMEDLLTHRFPFRNDPLSFRTAYAAEVPAGDYRALIESASDPHDSGFSYTNLGYLIYGAALELKTGQSWKDALVEHVLAPLGLENTSPYPSRFAPGIAAGGHQWAIDRFIPARLKPDTLMHAAGGLVSSPADLARWLRAWLDKGGGGIPAASFEFAQRLISEAEEQEIGPGLKCTGYAMGWNVCEAGGATLYLHGGGYTGIRSGMAWSDDLDTGFAVLTNSDSMTGQMSQELLRQFFLGLADPSTEMPPADAFAAKYGERVRTLADNRIAVVAERREEEIWKGWRWRPGPRDLAAYVGRYHHPDFGTLWVSQGDDGLVFRLGETRMDLEPATRDVFGGSQNALGAPDPILFERDVSGGIQAVTWEEERFVRTG